LNNEHWTFRIVRNAQCSLLHAQCPIPFGFSSPRLTLTGQLSVRKIISVKTPKKQSKEPSLPSQDESRRTNVLFEKLISEFRTVGESVSAVRERVDRIEPQLNKLNEKVDVLESAVRTHTDAIRANTEATRAMQTDLKNINQRLEVVETKLAS